MNLYNAICPACGGMDLYLGDEDLHCGDCRFWDGKGLASDIMPTMQQTIDNFHAQLLSQSNARLALQRKDS